MRCANNTFNHCRLLRSSWLTHHPDQLQIQAVTFTSHNASHDHDIGLLQCRPLPAASTTVSLAGVLALTVAGHDKLSTG